MNSKEALAVLIHNLKEGKSKDAMTGKPNEDLFSIVFEDLDTLEMLKSHIRNAKEMGMPLTGAIEILLWFNGKEAETIKEWLKND